MSPPFTCAHVRSCDGCGACCMSQYSPPGYVIFAKPPPWIDEVPDDDFDRVTYESAPGEAKAAIVAYAERILAGEHIDDQPCCWFDLDTLRCKWYDWRPSICREFEIDTKECHAWRFLYHTERDQTNG